jgi:hypothetical protein
MAGVEGQKAAKERHQGWFAGIAFQTRSLGIETGLLQELSFEGVPWQECPENTNR